MARSTAGPQCSPIKLLALLLFLPRSSSSFCSENTKPFQVWAEKQQFTVWITTCMFWLVENNEKNNFSRHTGREWKRKQLCGLYSDNSETNFLLLLHLLILLSDCNTSWCDRAETELDPEIENVTHEPTHKQEWEGMIGKKTVHVAINCWEN